MDFTSYTEYRAYTFLNLCAAHPTKIIWSRACHIWYSFLNILFIINKQTRFLGIPYKPRLIRLTVDPLNFCTILTN